MAAFAEPQFSADGMPSSLHTEVAILGAMLLDAVAISDATAKLRDEDFSLDSHQRIYRAILELLASNHAVDFLTVQDALAKKRELDAIGGPAYLAYLTEGIPRNLNIESYVRIVKDKSLLRQLMSIFSDGMALASDQTEEATKVLNDVEARLADVADSAINRGFSGIAEIVANSFGSIDALYEQGREITGLATHYIDFDKMTSGLQPSELIIIAARPSMGKAQPLTSKILTPAGFIPMSDITVGSRITGSDGRPCSVSGVYPQGVMPVYRVSFSDGTSTECTEEHLWWTQTRNERRRRVAGSVKTLKEIRNTILRPDGGKQNHAIPLTGPVEYDSEDVLTVPPYTLGILLGDGCLSEGHGKNAVFCNPEEDILLKVRAELNPLDEVVRSGDGITCLFRRKQRNNDVSETAKLLSELGVMGPLSSEKSIPPRYMRGSVEDRRSLLAGLLDTDGHVNKTGRTIEYSSSSPVLANQVTDLARGLGMRVSFADRIPGYIYKGQRLQGKRSYRVRIYAGEENPTRSAKHAVRWDKTPSRATHRAIVSVEYVGPKECQCIRVDAPDSLYVTDDFILTHNTAWAINIAQNCAVRDHKVVAVFSLEMSKESLLRRMLASEASVNSRLIQNGFIPRSDRDKLINALERLMTSKMFIDDTPGITLAEMRAKCRRLMQQEGRLDLIVIDYLQLMTGSAGSTQKKFENRTQEVSSISRGLKALAKELRVPVVALSQLSRGSEQRTGDKKPLLSDLRESGSIEQDADVVAFIHREEYYNREDEDLKGKAEIIIAKQRNGPTGSVKLAYLADFTRFENLAFEDAGGGDAY